MKYPLSELLSGSTIFVEIDGDYKDLEVKVNLTKINKK